MLFFYCWAQSGTYSIHWIKIVIEAIHYRSASSLHYITFVTEDSLVIHNRFLLSSEQRVRNCITIIVLWVSSEEFCFYFSELKTFKMKIANGILNIKLSDIFTISLKALKFICYWIKGWVLLKSLQLFWIKWLH